MTAPRPGAPTVYIETYGCQMNVADSERMYGTLVAHGYAPVDAPDGTIALPVAPPSRRTVTSTVGFPRESSTSRPTTSTIFMRRSG